MSENKTLNDYLEAWNLSNPQLLTQTATSHIYTVTHDTETAILKLLSPSETDEQRGAAALRYFDGRGAVRLLRFDDGAHLLEYAAGAELVTLVESGEDEQATRIIARVIRQLHSVPLDHPRHGLIAGLKSCSTKLRRTDRLASSLYMYEVHLSRVTCSLLRAIYECYTVISITATSGSHRAAGSPLTRKA